MARGIQLNNQQVNETFSPQDQRVRERAWLLALQMESTVSSAKTFRDLLQMDSTSDNMHDRCLSERRYALPTSACFSVLFEIQYRS